ncbi:MAG: aldo/keto reductase [Myxococcota bacterium]|nr:aldo/keto reductase [Myxococcota bacterium]
MKFTRLGSTGLEVSRLCLGMMTYGSPAWREWVLDEEASVPLLRAAYEAGIRFFDTADMYSNGVSEEILGRFLREHARRDEVVVATKLFYPLRDEGPNRQGLSRKRVFDCVDASLQRLGCDYVDLYQIHRFDSETPIEETLLALDDVVRAGKVRYVGASSMRAFEFAKLLHTADRLGLRRMVSMQNHYNLISRDEEREMVPLCRTEGVGLIPYSPLARGFLAGNRRRGSWEATTRARTDAFGGESFFRDADFDVQEAVVALAEKRGVAPAQVALAWLLAKPGVSAPIIGVSKPAQLEDALAALEIDLSEDELSALEVSYQPRADRGFL